ncbi:MAG: hypothetical protein IPL52_11795 [Flavobacteriales bacterium]|nr:hypothetical protein [Flavobacteriales bacterium]
MAKDCIVTLHLARKSADGTVTQLASILPGMPYNASIPLPLGDSLVISYSVNSFTYCGGYNISYSAERPVGCAIGTWGETTTLHIMSAQDPHLTIREFGLLLIRTQPTGGWYYAGSACIYLYEGPVGIEEAAQVEGFDPKWMNGTLILGENPKGQLGVYDDMGRLVWSGSVERHSPPLPIGASGTTPAVITVQLTTSRERYARRIISY